MNPIVELFSKISDEELHQAIKDIKSAQDTGIYSEDSIVRKCAHKVREITNQVTSLDLLSSEISLLREAANRWDSEDKSYLILSGEGGYETENQFVMETKTLKEAEENFENFKNGTYRSTYLMLYEGKQLKVK